MSIAYRDFFQRLCSATDIRTQMDLARALNLNRSAITQAKIRDSVPQKWILALSRRYTLSPDWLEFGTGQARPCAHDGPAVPERHISPSPGQFPLSMEAEVALSPDEANAVESPDVVYIPKAAARLCAGGGSFEVDAAPIARYPVPRAWIASLGRPAGMVCMDVVGDSMEPGIYDGDMVIVDTSNKNFTPPSIMAVGFEDAIYLKRVFREQEGLTMHSDNPAYGPVTLQGDELESFHVIGRMVWLCRRY